MMFRLIVCTMLGLSTASAFAQALVSGSGVVISAQDMSTDLLRVPPEVRANTFSKPEAVHGSATGLFVRRVLAAEALQAGLDKDESVKAALELARDRVLSDAHLALIDKANQPDQQATEAYALSTYKSNPKRFEVGEQVRARHILLRAGEPDARSNAEKLLKEVVAGANFEELAKARSQDPGSASKGGDLGLVTRGRMVKPFEDAMFKLTKVGEVSDVIETTFGFHIIKLEEKRPAGVKSFDEVKDTLMKEAQAAIVNNGRSKVQDKIMATAKFDTDAIEAFAKSQRK